MVGAKPYVPLEPVPARVRPAGQPGSDTRGGWGCQPRLVIAGQLAARNDSSRSIATPASTASSLPTEHRHTIRRADPSAIPGFVAFGNVVSKPDAATDDER